MMRKLGRLLSGEAWLRPEQLQADMDCRVEAIEERFDGLEERVEVLEQEQQQEVRPGQGRPEQHG